jgi:hypothetical protein
MRNETECQEASKRLGDELKRLDGSSPIETNSEEPENEFL